MGQLAMFDEPCPAEIVNVASVPKRSPFRYPGGKTWLIPLIRRWLRSLDSKPRILVEPFLGGGIVSLTAAFERLADTMIMVEIDDDVAAVWETITGPNNEGLAKRILQFDLTPENAESELNREPVDRADQAFQTLLRNRISHGGILARGSGLIKNGENGRGIKSRWYPRTLSQRIRDICAIADTLNFVQADGMEVIVQHQHEPDVPLFVDPPYTAAGKRAGKRLYNHNELDHPALFREMALVKGDFLITYDYADAIIDLAKDRGFDFVPIAMKNTHHARMTELLIGRDLSWART